MIALHAALLARKVGKAVRIYDRHEDLSATTKRHPASIHHRTGVMRDGRLVAQEIDVVMDGAYCTLTPWSCRAACCTPAVRIGARTCASAAARWPPTRRPTGPSAASARRRPSSPPRCRSTASPRRWRSAARAAPSWAYREGDDADRPGPARERRSGGGARGRAEASDFARHSEQTRRAREARQSGARLAPGSGWRWAGTAPGSPDRARCTSPASPRSS